VTPDERLDGFGQRLVGILNDAMLDTDEMIDALYKLASEMRWAANTVPAQPTPPAVVLALAACDHDWEDIVVDPDFRVDVCAICGVERATDIKNNKVTFAPPQSRRHTED
jgi:hypothetical protein